jgi:methyl-accepting chemotaxis protein
VALDISEMTYIISGISEQTKILALNAAIEAARAGDAGRGFSVVSTEIRSLAESVGRSASRIEDLVSGVQATSDSSSRPRNGRRNSPGVDGEEAEQLHRGMEGFKTS